MNVVERAKRILVSPATEWPVIAGESTPTGNLITGYVLPLAAVSAIAGFIGLAFIGVGVPMVGTRYYTPVGAGLVSLVWSLVMAVAGVFVCGFVINALAPTFGAAKSDAQSLKAAAYSFTPVWVAGILQIIPPLSVLVILAALYAIYVLYVGLPVLMKVPADKNAGYTAAVIICTFVAMFILSAIGGLFFGAAMVGARMY